MIKKTISNFIAHTKTLAEKPIGKKILRIFSFLLTSLIVTYLIYKLTLIGWSEVWKSLPQHPLFYMYLLVMFFSLPVFQVFIYRIAWNKQLKPWPLFLALMNKRVLDKDVLGYSGEMYLYLWARKHIKHSQKEILHVLKDNVIISSSASTLVAVILLIIFFSLGRIKIPQEWLNPKIIHLLVLGFCIILTIGFFSKFRKRIFFLKKKIIIKIFLLHIARLIFVQGIQILQWMVVLPEVPIVNWFTLLAVQIIITRIPLLPSRDLIFMGTGIEMSNMISASNSSLAAMLLANSVINKLLNLLFFILVFISTRKTKTKEHKILLNNN